MIIRLFQGINEIDRPKIVHKTLWLPSYPGDLQLGILLSAIIRSFSVISLLHMSTSLELKLCKTMLLKSKFLSESNSEILI